MIEKVDVYIAKHEQWSKELKILRSIALNCGMDESFKWSFPVYMINKKNVLSFGAFKNHYGIWFFNGVFLKDKYKLLINAQESTKAMRQMRFERDAEIDEPIVKQYFLEAIENQKKGSEVKPKKSITFEIPELFDSALNIDGKLKIAYQKLSFGKQKEYANYITAAKQEKTKLSRIEKIKPMIFDGIGLHDKYRKRSIS